jgi:hypothetical protein
MDDSSNDTPFPNQTPRRHGIAMVREVLIGTLFGIVLGATWIVLAVLLGGEGGSVVGLGFTGCMLFLGLCLIVACGAAVGYAIAGATGAIIAGVACYFVLFIVYGIRVQLTTGWSAWFRVNDSRRRGDGNGKD